jgi:hypothetical protein
VTPARKSKVAKPSWVVKLATFDHAPYVKVLIFFSFWKGCQRGQLGPPCRAGHLRPLSGDDLFVTTLLPH